MPRGIITGMYGGTVISGSVSSAKGTFAHGLNKKPSLVIVCPTGATGTAIGILWDADNSDTSNIILVGPNANYETFVAVCLTD